MSTMFSMDSLHLRDGFPMNAESVYLGLHKRNLIKENYNKIIIKKK